MKHLRAPLNNPIEPDPIRVLVVHDDPLLRGLLHALFEDAGYDVLQAGTGLDGLRMIGQSRPPVDLLVTDYRLPGMSGAELAPECHRLRVDLRVLYVSGPCLCEDLDDDLTSPPDVFVNTFRADALLRMAKELLLDESPPFVFQTPVRRRSAHS
jgi:CheY-like chemotaxis protein